MQDLQSIWIQHPRNPLLMPPVGVYADPVLLTPVESPDGYWHLFSCDGINLNHWISLDGIQFRLFRNHPWFGYTQFIFSQDGEYYLIYQRYSGIRGELVLRSSKDLQNWSKPQLILAPSLDWESRIWSCVRNPCLIEWKGKYHLYY